MPLLAALVLLLAAVVLAVVFLCFTEPPPTPGDLGVMAFGDLPPPTDVALGDTGCKNMILMNISQKYAHYD